MASTSLPPWITTDWSATGPLLDLDRITGARTKWRIAHYVARKFRVKLDQLMVRRFLRTHQVRVVLGEFLDFSLDWLEAVQALGLPFFAHAHGRDVSGCLREPKWRTAYLRYNTSNGVITMSHANREELIALGLSPSKVMVVPYGVEVPAEPPVRPERDEIRCMAVGRMVPQKAPILLLDAFRRAAEQHPSLRLDYIGDGYLLAAAQHFISAFHLEDRVTLRGSKSNAVVLDRLREADLFLQHSVVDPINGDREGLPVTILEAMAQALPVVSTREAGIPEAVQEAITGFLVQPGDSEAMAARILSLARDHGLRQRLGQAAWRRAKDHFSWELERARLLQILGLESAS